MQVREIMTNNPACCTPDTTLQEVARLMVEHDCGMIPVVDSESNLKPVGTITDRDITIRTFAAKKNPLNTKVSEIMTNDIVTIKPETSVQECGEVMKKADIRRVLVTDKTGKCIGIVAQADLAQYGPNPNLIGDVVNEISQSAPSAKTTAIRGRENTSSFSFKKSFLNFNSLLPLVAGVGAGAAIKYYLYPTPEKTQKHSKVKQRVELPITKKEDRFEKMAAEMNSHPSNLPIEDTETTVKITKLTVDDKPETKTEIGRSATQH